MAKYSRDSQNEESNDKHCFPVFPATFSWQERTRSFDGFSMHSLENSLIDIMRAEQDSLKGLFLFKTISFKLSCFVGGKQVSPL